MWFAVEQIGPEDIAVLEEAIKDLGLHVVNKIT
jgi:hypothetical protein